MSISNTLTRERGVKRNGIGIKLGVALLSAFTLVFASFTPNAFAASVIKKGHTDAFFIDITAKKPTVQIRNGMGNNLYDMATTEIQVADYSYRKETDCNDTFETFYSGYYRQLGEVGKDGYYTVCGASNNPGMSAPGQADLGVDVKIKFTKVAGPGKIAFYNNNSLAKEDDDSDLIVPFMESGNFFIKAGDVFKVPGHQHGLWFFEHAGLYSLTGRAIVTKSDGSSISSDPFTLNLRVMKSGKDARTAPAPKVLSEIPDSTQPNEPGTGGTGTDQPGGSDTGTGGSNGGGSDTTPVQPGADNSTPNTPGVDTPPSTGPRVVLSKGHIDLFNVIAQNGKLVLNAKDDSGIKPVERKAEDVIVHVGEHSKTDFPNKFASMFGAQAAYLLGQSGDKQDVLPFPGWETMGVRPDFGAIDLEFLDVKGPGQVFAFLSNAFNGPSSPLSSGKFAVVAGEKIHQEEPSHVHTNWVFTKPGVYTMKMRAKDARPGATAISNEATYMWYVGQTVPKELIDGTYTGDPTEIQPGNGGKTPGNTSGGNSGLPNEELPSGDSAQPSPQPNRTPAPQPVPSGNNSGVVVSPAVNQAKYVDAIIPMMKDDRTQPAKWVDPKSLTFAIGDAGRATTQENIGNIPAGSAVWMISSSQVAGVPWLGVNSQHPTLLAKTTGQLKLALTSFSGPGSMEVFYSNNFGGIGQRLFSGANGSAGGSIVLSPNIHAHPNWVFTKPGTYRVGITTSATLKNGKTVSNHGTLVFNVGSGDGVTSGHFDFGAAIGQALAGSAGTGAGRGGASGGVGRGTVATSVLDSLNDALASGDASLADGTANSENASVKELSGAGLGDAMASSDGAGSGSGGWTTTNTLIGSGVVLLLVNTVLQAMRLMQMRRMA